MRRSEIPERLSKPQINNSIRKDSFNLTVTGIYNRFHIRKEFCTFVPINRKINEWERERERDQKQDRADIRLLVEKV